MELLYWDPSRPFCMSSQTDQLDAQLAKVIPQIPPVPKNGRSHHGAYVLLDDIYEAIREPLERHGVTCEQYTSIDGWVILRIAFNGQFILSGCKAPSDDNAKNKIQAMGGAFSYLKRYGLGATFRISTDEDTDGNTNPHPQQNHSPNKEFKASPNKPSSAPQHNLIKRLSREKNKGHVGEILSLFGITNEEKLVSLNAAQASELIEELQKLEN